MLRIKVVEARFEHKPEWIGLAILSGSISAALCIGITAMLLFPQFF